MNGPPGVIRICPRCRWHVLHQLRAGALYCSSCGYRGRGSAIYRIVRRPAAAMEMAR